MHHPWLCVLPVRTIAAARCPGMLKYCLASDGRNKPVSWTSYLWATISSCLRQVDVTALANCLSTLFEFFVRITTLSALGCLLFPPGTAARTLRSGGPVRGVRSPVHPPGRAETMLLQRKFGRCAFANAAQAYQSYHPCNSLKCVATFACECQHQPVILDGADSWTRFCT